MPHFLEPVTPPTIPELHTKQTCPFCNTEKDPDATSFIGDQNDASKLEDKLAADGQPRTDLDFEHDDYGKYSGEPHHLVSGNEAMKGHPIERWLKKDSQVRGDTGFDINSARNGQWLPSIPDENRICSWTTVSTRVKTKSGYVMKKRRVPSESDRDKKMWSALSEEEKDLVSFSIMITNQLQFHKGNHRNKGEKPSECYITEVQRLLDGINEFVSCHLDLQCPELANAPNSPYPPPYGINSLIYGVASAHMRWHVNGPPESWFVFVSKLARRLYQEVIDEGKTPWDIPYPGHPDRS